MSNATRTQFDRLTVQQPKPRNQSNHWNSWRWGEYLCSVCQVCYFCWTSSVSHCSDSRGWATQSLKAATLRAAWTIICHVRPCGHPPIQKPIVIHRLAVAPSSLEGHMYPWEWMVTGWWKEKQCCAQRVPTTCATWHGIWHNMTYGMVN